MANAFNAQRPAVAAERFTFGGRVLQVGEDFPHQALGVEPLTLDGLWRTGKIRFIEPAAPPQALPPATKPPAAPAKRFDRRRR